METCVQITDWTDEQIYLLHDLGQNIINNLDLSYYSSSKTCLALGFWVYLVCLNPDLKFDPK